ncbi:isopentenyl-diphosphate Delta-isomerase [Kitasatospora purpeofusca]|uniref:isopentenyl-diphosphate Delta-isomerase n=1 Tax=Kitasatospora purpeofusca TaxID=67352 RepID=UPI00369D3016
MSATDDRRSTDLVELVDAEGNACGSTGMIDAHTHGKRHRAYSLMLFDGRGNVLLQRRAAHKTRFAGIWGPTCCGHPAPGQDVVAHARLHCFEELGISGVEPREVGTVDYDLGDPTSAYVEVEHNHVLIAFYSGTPAAHPEEIDEVRWLPVAELARELDDPPDGVRYAEWLRPVADVAVPAAEKFGLLNVDATRAHDTHQRNVYSYYQFKTSDKINTEAGPDDCVHSHFALTPYNPTVLEVTDPGQRQDAILREIHRMENLQCEAVIDLMPPLPPTGRVLDAACGRGGTSFRAWERFGCTVHGVDFSEQRVAFANAVAARRGVSDQVRFFHANVEDTGLPEHSYDVVLFNEAAVHVPDMRKLFAETARLLRPGGSLVLVEWIADSRTTRTAAEVTAINNNYYTALPSRGEVLSWMLTARLVPVQVADRRRDVLPYWELRSHSNHRTGVENPFVTAFTAGSMNYLLCVAAYQPDHVRTLQDSRS